MHGHQQVLFTIYVSQLAMYAVSVYEYVHEVCRFFKMATACGQNMQWQ